MKLCFELSMPGCPSWNGKWSGESNFYAKVKSFSNSKIGKKKVEDILANQPYYHHWSDGWTAKVKVYTVDGATSKSIVKKSNGFLGYDWMIDEIIAYGEIRN